jgi:hypothetical protein
MHRSLSLVLILLLAYESPTDFAVELWDVLDLLAAEAVAANGSVSAAFVCLALVLEALAWEQEHESACLDSLVLVQLAVLETTVHLVNRTLASCPLDHTSSSLGLSLVVVLLVVLVALVVNLPVSASQACPHHQLASHGLDPLVVNPVVSPVPLVLEAAVALVWGRLATVAVMVDLALIVHPHPRT